jgi:transposase InsO family protein
VKHAFIASQGASYPVLLMCKQLGVSRSGYYRHLAPKSEGAVASEEADKTLLEKIAVIFEAKKKRYGSPRIHAELQQQAVVCSRGRVARLMRAEGLCALSGKKYRRRRERQDVTETKNLLLEHNIRPTEVNQVWHTDITMIATDEGWLYLAGVMDGLSKRIVGYAADDHMKTDLVIEALRSAVKRRGRQECLIHHSDRGSQYTSYAYQRELTAQKMLPSFTAKGACLDNACMESFWATLKKELVYSQKRFATRDEARQAVFEYIHVFYNRERLHSSLGYTSPELFEALQQPLEGLEILAA